MNRNAYVLLMMIRCQYIDGIKLTTKGGKLIPVFVWRMWNHILVKLFPHYKDDVINCLECIQKKNPTHFMSV